MEIIRLEDLTKSEVCFVYSTIGYIKGQLCSKYVGEINNYQTKMSICNDVNELLCQLTSQDYLVSDNNMLSYAELSLDKTIEYLDRKNVKTFSSISLHSLESFMPSLYSSTASSRGVLSSFSLSQICFNRLIASSKFILDVPFNNFNLGSYNAATHSDSQLIALGKLLCI